MPARAHRATTVQRFRPTNGTIVGGAGLALAAALAAYLLVTDPSLGSVRAALGLALLGLVIWVALLRPRAFATRDVLVLRNMVSDVHVPLARIDAVVVRHTLNVWVGDRRYVCVGIGRSTRSLTKRRSRGAMAAVGLEQTDDRMGLLHVGEIGTSGDYHSFVEARIEDLARSARRDGAADPPPVRRTWAVTELAALGLVAALLGASLLVG